MARELLQSTATAARRMVRVRRARVERSATASEGIGRSIDGVACVMLRAAIRGASRAGGALQVAKVTSTQSSLMAQRAFTRQLTTEAETEAAKTTAGKISDALGTVALIAGTIAGAIVGGSMYVETTQELEASVDANEHVPSTFRGTVIEKPYSDFMIRLLLFRQWMDDQSHNYLDPISDKLLPDHPPQAEYIPHTLVLDLDDTLINSNWKRERGWRVFKRPGVDGFLKHMAQFYEMVIFTDQLMTYGDPIIERLDPTRYVSHRLYRESAQYKNGEYIRDLSKLNRDMGQILYISSKPRSAELHPANVIPIKPWTYEDGSKDTALLDLMPFLESIVRLNVQDVRVVLESYKKECAATGKDIPTIFRERQVAFQRRRQDKLKSTNKAIDRGYNFGRGKTASAKA
jgi:mitochondrial import inner membrane translocase subunit TIM50